MPWRSTFATWPGPRGCRFHGARNSLRLLIQGLPQTLDLRGVYDHMRHGAFPPFHKSFNNWYSR